MFHVMDFLFTGQMMAPPSTTASCAMFPTNPTLLRSPSTCLSVPYAGKHRTLPLNPKSVNPHNKMQDLHHVCIAWNKSVHVYTSKN